jgi:hypothetical protein
MSTSADRVAAFHRERRVRVLSSRPRLVLHHCGPASAPPIERVLSADEQYEAAREIGSIALKLGAADLYRLRDIARTMAG